MTPVSLRPFAPEPGMAYESIGASFTVTLGKMLDAGRELNPQASFRPYIRAANIRDSGLDLSDVKSMPFTAAESAALDLRREDILVVEGGAVGTCVVLEEDLPGWSFQKTVNRLRPTGSTCSRYVAYVLRAYRDAGVIDILCNRSTIPHLTAEKLRALRIPAWPPDVQRAIADFLDRETARIDTLIQEQQRLIQLLQERRQATIADAVHGPPIVRLRRLVDPDRPMTYGILQCGPPVDDGVPYIGPSDMPGHGQSPSLESLRRTTVEIASTYSRSVLMGGDVVVSIGPAYGKVAVIDPELAGANLTQDTVRVAALPNLVDSRYLVWVLISRHAAQFWDLEIMGATFRRLNLGTLARTPIPLPPLEEQRRIVAYLDEQTTKIDALIAESERFIELARERRAALITAAVTGQIDVTGRAA